VQPSHSGPGTPVGSPFVVSGTTANPGEASRRAKKGKLNESCAAWKRARCSADHLGQLIGTDPFLYEPEDSFDYSSPSPMDIAPMIAVGIESTETSEQIQPPTEEEKAIIQPLHVYLPDPEDPWSLWLLLRSDGGRCPRRRAGLAGSRRVVEAARRPQTSSTHPVIPRQHVTGVSALTCGFSDPRTSQTADGFPVASLRLCPSGDEGREIHDGGWANGVRPS
jgi:hypothetical protein